MLFVTLSHTYLAYRIINLLQLQTRTASRYIYSCSRALLPFSALDVSHLRQTRHSVRFALVHELATAIHLHPGRSKHGRGASQTAQLELAIIPATTRKASAKWRAQSSKRICFSQSTLHGLQLYVHTVPQPVSLMFMAPPNTTAPQAVKHRTQF